jgi:subtilase family serine protease
MVTVIVAAVMILSFFGIVFSSQGSSTSAAADSSQTFSSGSLENVQAAAFNGSSQQIGSMVVTPDAGAFSPSYQMSVYVTLKPSGSLSAYANEVSDPSSPMYRQFLNQQDLTEMFGNQAQYDQVAAYFSSMGLNVQGYDNMGMYITGSVLQMESAFHTSIQAFNEQTITDGVYNPSLGNVSAQSGQTVNQVVYGSTTEVQLPSSIAQYVSGIAGFSGLTAQPQIAMPSGMMPGQSVSTSLGSSQPSQLQYLNKSEFLNYEIGDYGWTYYSPTGGIPAPYQFLFPGTMPALTGSTNLWNGNSTINSEPDTGQGVTIAVIEVGLIDPSYLSEFSAEVFGNSNQLPDRVTQIGVGIPTLNDGILIGEEYGWTLETALDIEYAATMAPGAHIDVIGVPSSEYTSFFDAYSFVTNYLTGGQPLNVPAGNVVYGPSAGATSVTITSNSYGSGEQYLNYYGSPMYETVANQLLDALNAVGVTNFFASGDYGSWGGDYEAAASAEFPAISSGSTSVGGGMVTAYGSNGQEFPVTNTVVNFTEVGPIYAVPAKGIESYTYWSYGEGISGTEMGLEGGGFGESMSQNQPWYQNAMDTFSTGAATDPIISGSAAFNMTVFVYGEWIFFYGGTSFATPITAGEWALIEEQSLAAFGSDRMGNINPLLFEVHNSNQAGVPGVSVNPYVDMTNIGVGYDWAPLNSYSYYYYNLSINQPSDPVLPQWYASLNNPAGNGWNFLQGLGMVKADVMDSEIIGTIPEMHSSLVNQGLFVMQVSGKGSSSPFYTLYNETSYTFQISRQDGSTGGIYDVTAYSGGMMTTFQTNSSGMFTYVPSYVQSSPATGGSELGYFYVTVPSGSISAPWGFSQYAVMAPMATGNLTLGVTGAYGNLETSVAQIPMFTIHTTGNYNPFPSATVMLDGVPVANAVISEVAVNVNYSFPEGAPSLSPSYYAPGVTIGHFLTDYRGNAEFWDDSLYYAENNGSVNTNIFVLTASYHGLVSNPVTVYVEPQSGSFFPVVNMNGNGTDLYGQVIFNDLKYVNYVNVSIGSMPGQYTNVTYPQTYLDDQSGLNIMMSTVSNGVVPFNFTNLPAPGTTIELNITAQGVDDMSFVEVFSEFGETFSFAEYAVANPITWMYQVPVSNSGGDPSSSLSASVSGIANGTFTASYSGIWDHSGAKGSLVIINSQGQSVLATGLRGQYEINTANLPYGYNVLNYMVTTTTGLSSESTYAFFVGPSAASVQNDLSAIGNEISSLKSGSTVNPSVMFAAVNPYTSGITGSYSNQVSSYLSQAQALQSEISSVMASISSIPSAIAPYMQSQITLETQVQSYGSQLSSYQSQLGSYIQQLESLSTKSRAGTASPLAFIMTGGVLAMVIIGSAIALSALGIVLFVTREIRKRNNKKEISTKIL